MAVIIGAVVAVLFLIRNTLDQANDSHSPTLTDTVCIQVVTKAYNPKTGGIKDFPTSCDVPSGWEKVELNTEMGITVVSVKENQVVTSSLKIAGFVTGNGWVPFEAQAGTVELVDAKGTRLAFGILTTPGEWMHLPSYFETIVTMDYSRPFTKTGTLIFINDNPSGLLENFREYRLPVQFEDQDILK